MRGCSYGSNAAIFCRSESWEANNVEAATISSVDMWMDVNVQ